MKIFGKFGKNMLIPPPKLWPVSTDNPDLGNRTYYQCKDLDTYVKGGHSNYDEVEEKDANLVSSLLENGMHAPTLDIDLPCRLVESSTPGHFHLFIDGIELDWDSYEMLLSVLADVGIIEEGYYTNSLRQGKTMLRKPGVKKTQRPQVEELDGY